MTELNTELPRTSAQHEQSTGAEEALRQLRILDNMVGKHDSIRHDFEVSDQSTAYDEFERQKLTELLHSEGIQDDAEDENQHEKFQLALKLAQEASRLDEIEWLTRDSENNLDMPRRNTAFEMLLDKHYTYVPRHRADIEPHTEPGGAPEGTDEHEGHERTPVEWEAYAAEFEDYAKELSDKEIAEAWDEAHAMNGEFTNAHQALNRARELWAAASARRQGRAFSLKDKNRDALEADYTAKLREFGIMYLGHNIDPHHPNYSEEDASRRVNEYLFAEQVQLRELTTEKLKNTRTSKFVEWMNRGGKLAKLGKSALVGVAAAGIAGGIVLTGGLLAGATVAGVGLGTAAGGAAAGATGFGRFMRGFAKSDRQRGMQTAEEAHGVNGASINLAEVNGVTTEDRFDNTRRIYNKSFETDTQKEQTKRRKAVGRGAVNVALGVGVGALVTGLSEVAGLGDGDHAIDNPGSDSIGNHIGNTGGSPDSLDHSLLDSDGDGIANAQDIAPHNPDIGAIDFSEITHDARWIDHGEGGFRTLQELGVPEEKWEAVWADAGQHFADDGKTYLMDDGRYGWSNPGQLTNGDLTELVKAAHRQGVALDFTLAA